jgi:hypothetical protein
MKKITTSKQWDEGIDWLIQSSYASIQLKLYLDNSSISTDSSTSPWKPKIIMDLSISTILNPDIYQTHNHLLARLNKMSMQYTSNSTPFDETVNHYLIRDDSRCKVFTTNDDLSSLNKRYNGRSNNNQTHLHADIKLHKWVTQTRLIFIII